MHEIIMHPTPVGPALRIYIYMYNIHIYESYILFTKSFFHKCARKDINEMIFKVLYLKIQNSALNKLKILAIHL